MNGLFAWLAQDFNLKLFALAAAVALFFFVSVENVTPIDVEFSLEYRLSDEAIFTNEPPSLLRVTLQGPWAALRTYEASALEPVVLDLRHANLGPQRLLIDPSYVHPPSGMRVAALQPSSLEVVLDRRIERRLPVRADIAAKPPLGFVISSLRLVPNKARVVGPTSKLQMLDFVSTRSIDMSNNIQDITIDVELTPLPPPSRLLDKRVTVYIDIVEEWITRTFQNIPVILQNAPAQSTLSPNTVDITLKGPRRLLEKMGKDQLQAYVDLTMNWGKNQLQGDRAIRLRQELPERVQWIGGVPKVHIQIPRRKR